jgi:hypothetical protein
MTLFRHSAPLKQNSFRQTTSNADGGGAHCLAAAFTARRFIAFRSYRPARAGAICVADPGGGCWVALPLARNGFAASTSMKRGSIQGRRRQSIAPAGKLIDRY